MANFKKGDIVVNESGSYSKILKVNNGVHNGTKWTEDVAFARQSKEGNVLFNEGAIKTLKIKLASKKDQVKEEVVEEVVEEEVVEEK